MLDGTRGLWDRKSHIEAIMASMGRYDGRLPALEEELQRIMRKLEEVDPPVPCGA